MNFVFLLYVSRSGSTYLSNALAQASNEVLPMPEIDFPILLVRHFINNKQSISRNRLEKIIKSDNKIEGLGMPKDFASEIAKQTSSLKLDGILKQFVLQYCRNKTIDMPTTVIFKRGEYACYFEDILKLLPDAKFIHIYRDPRAVINSMLRTKRVYRRFGNIANNDVILNTMYWKSYVNAAINHQNNNKPLINVRYESIASDAKSMIDGILEFLGNKRTVSCNRVILPESEKSLHVNIQKRFISERTDYWIRELGRERGAVIEYLSKDFIKKLGYKEFYRAKPTMKSWLYELLKTAAGKALNVVNNFVFYCGNPYVRIKRKCVRLFTNY
jgi:hypothetical protein